MEDKKDEQIKKFKEELKEKEWILKKTDTSLKALYKELEGVNKQLESKVKDRTKELEFLSKTAMEFVEVHHEVDIYDLITKRLRELIGNCVTGLSSVDMENRIMEVQSVHGLGRRSALLDKLIGQNLVGMKLDLNRIPKNDLNKMSEPNLSEVKNPAYRAFLGAVPKAICNIIEKTFDITKCYRMGLRRGGKVFGNMAIFLIGDKDLENKSIIEAYLNQGAIALERREIEGKLRIEQEKRIQEMMEVDRMKDDFLSITTHELKTPLMPIKLNAEMLATGRYGELTKEQRGSLKTIVRNANRLSHLVDDIMTIVKIDQKELELHKQKADLIEMIKDIGSDMALEAGEKDLYFKVHTPKNMLKVRVDKARIKQVLVNIINNSIKFTEKGGITVTTVIEEENILVTIEDTGIGIPQNELEKIFNRFYQIDQTITRQYPGTGLGLAIAKSIIDIHGGKIWAESEGPGKGSKLSFTIPKHKK